MRIFGVILVLAVLGVLALISGGMEPDGTAPNSQKVYVPQTSSDNAALKLKIN